MMLSAGYICVLLGGSIFWVELVRDLYHVLAHIWSPLGRLHNWHHRVFRPDLTPVSAQIYRQAHWYNDLPESLVMLTLSFLPGLIGQHWAAWAGSVYTLSFLLGAIARGLGLVYADELTDITHRPGEFTSLPARWFVNRPYHWRHHFDNQKAYYCGTLTLVDKIMGTALSLKGKTVAVTGASGTLGQSLLKHLQCKGAKVIALTSKQQNVMINGQVVKTITWQVGQEVELAQALEKVDILLLNHGINGHGQRTPEAITQSYEINALSSWRFLELFLTTVRTNADKVTKEVWVNTSEAEVSPAFSPLYELSKRTLGDLVTLRRLDSPCIIRKLILGPFKSNLNPIGVMSADWVAKMIVTLAQRDFRNIIITINPLTYLVFPVKELFVSLYFRFFTCSSESTARVMPERQETVTSK